MKDMSLDKIIMCDNICIFFRIGAIIIFLHDGSDVFMEIAKICKYSEKEFRASVGFSFLALSWLLHRTPGSFGYDIS
ncbi:unnamed protein product [Eruca vesicaria subsp. sativa]|uniref:TLC domain-containing protein n=1 Tax=Eruca vesicaria subsp. sativa TaxID=29727 RepID=A0ABC8L4F4_ERUVS|nr:unnamed protein product [Eruca vesicaria subsp. sativa]